MLNLIRQLLLKPAVSPQQRAFITELANSEIWILAIGLRGIPAIPSIYDPAALDMIAAHKIDVAELGDDDSVFPFNYTSASKQVLPFFKSEAHAIEFSNSGCFDVDITIFQPCDLMAGFVGAPENDVFELVYQAGFPEERALSQDEKRLLRSLARPL